MLPYSLDETSCPNVNALWGAVAAATLERLGVETVVLSPGSRSAPLAVAFAASKMEVVPVLDERSAAFFALGRAKLTRQPVVLVCTSGSAGAHYLPAVIEAHESHVPLIVLTADRPPEMRHCHSGQTIDQTKLYGGFVRFFAEAALPDAGDFVLRSWRALLRQAHRRSCGPDTGPVQVNVPFRDPLSPEKVGSGIQIASGVSARAFVEGLQPNAELPEIRSVGSELAGCGVVIVGPGQALPAGSDPGIVLADAASPERHRGGGVVAHYDLILRSEIVVTSWSPKEVTLVGPPPTSKVLRGWLERTNSEVVAVSAFPESVDPTHRAGRQTATMTGPGLVDESWQQFWRDADARVSSVFREELRATPAFFEGRLPVVLNDHLPEETNVHFASSMPVRDAEFFWPTNEKRFQPFANRGANGIDGMISTALGIGHRATSPTVLVMGDLAFLHDVGALAVRPKFVGTLTIFVINNRGGGIFENLPISQYDPPFEELFATPQEVSLADLCRAYGVEYVQPKEWAEVVELAEEAGSFRGLRVVELVTDRKRDTALRREIFAKAVNALEEAIKKGEIVVP